MIKVESVKTVTISGVDADRLYTIIGRTIKTIDSAGQLGISVFLPYVTEQERDADFDFLNFIAMSIHRGY